jgi:hypothetical protein
MVWLFDATQRFAYMKSAQRAFFSLGQTKHLDFCKKPVFLDFGFDVVEVEQFTDAITMVSGFGLSAAGNGLLRRSCRMCANPAVVQVACSSLKDVGQIHGARKAPSGG